MNVLYIVVQYLGNTNFRKKGRRKCDLTLRKRRVKTKTFSKITRIEEPDSSLSPKQPEPAQCKQSKFIYLNLETGRAYVVRCAIWYHLYILKNVKNTHGRVLILVEVQALACNFTKINTPP